MNLLNTPRPGRMLCPFRFYCRISMLALAFLAVSPVRATTFLVEAEQLEIPGGWEEVNLNSPEVRKFIVAGPSARQAPAAGAIEIPYAGKWKLWVRSKDFPADRPGTRKFTVRLGQTRSEVVFGKHGRAAMDGWAWEDGGTFELPAGRILIVVGDEATQSARCDALLLTDNMSYKPDDVPWRLEKPAARMAAVTISEESKRSFLPEPLQKVEEEPVATVQNETLRLTFHNAVAASGNVVAMRAATRNGNEWLPLSEDAGADSYRVLFRPRESDPKLVSYRVYPTWDISMSPQVDARCGDATVATRIGITTAPWASGRCFPLRPTSVRQVDSQTVELGFPAVTAGQLTAKWHLGSQQPAAEISMDFKPSGPGHFSLGYHAPLAAAPADTDFLLLPFMYHGHRFPEQPVAQLSALTPTPLTLVNRKGVSCALVAEPEELPFEWASPSNSRYAFGLRNETDQAQPFLYTPVLGQPGSVSEGAAVKGRFRLWIQRGDWYAAYRRVVDEVFRLSDYRRPTTASLSDAALNLFDLMRDAKASGWNARAKGPWNIESPNTVTHAAPLTYLSYYLLTGDQDFYNRFAQPALEFMISRPGAHFAAEREIWNNYYKHQPMRGPGSFFGATVFASAFSMTHGRTAAFGEFCLNDKGEPRPTARHGHMQPFEDALALYRLTGEQRWLNAAIAGADKYIAANLKTLPKGDLEERPFVNISFVPDWEGLLHLHEATGERRFLDAAVEGAHWLLTTLRTQPLVPNGDTKIHPGGIYDAQRHVWWWGEKLYRRGVYEGPATEERVYPSAPHLPERKVPAWKVSPVGLGLEQPSTYTRNGPHAQILMNAWAPNLLRLASPSGDLAFRTAARNAVIGRFANYPGYYLDGFTDQYQRPDYPIKGPDVTSLYVHHIPAFAAYVLDYLFSDAEMRSEGAVAFPWVRQCGYVWFDSRLYGHAPGKVYGQTAWPWLHRTAATVDNINVDRVLAHGDGKFHVVLLNQVREQQRVRVKLDSKVLGRRVDGATLQVHLNNKEADALTVKNGAVEITLEPLGIAALTLDGVKIDVPTHRIAPPSNLPLPQQSAVQRAAVSGSHLEAVGTVLEVPPFNWRDLYVYVTAGLDDCQAARLRYRVGDGREQQIEDKEFPWEFSARLTDMKEPISWSVDVQLASGDWVSASPSK